MTKVEIARAQALTQEMKTWTGKKWAAFNQHFSAIEVAVSLHAIDKEAYKGYMQEVGLSMTETIGGHYAQLTSKRGASYVDYTSMLAELAEMGIDTKALVEKHTKRRADTLAFSFK